MHVLAVIPAYLPSAGLPKTVKALLDGFCDQVIVVDDGSGEPSREIFAALAAFGNCMLLRHDVNRGKGAALKTAFAHILHACPTAEVIVTVDADGQHDPEDCRHVVEKLVSQKADACLGERSFSLRTTPFRSWWGNRWTSLVFWLWRRRWFEDTQTGLRAFRRALLPSLVAIPGDGYAYEMAALCALVEKRCVLAVHPIRTIYEQGNASSHYDPLRDTIRVFRALFARTSV